MKRGQQQITNRRREHRSSGPLNPAGLFGRRRLQVETLESRRMLSITVNTSVDEFDGSIVDGDISLRDAIAAAPAGETIDFNIGLDGDTITLTLGQMLIDDALTIDASSLPNGITIDADSASRIFEISNSDVSIVDVRLENLTLTGGVETVNGKGGAVSSVENLTIVDSTLLDNRASQRGGGLWSKGPVTIVSSNFEENTADFGGAIFVNNIVSITDSTFLDNHADTEGGAIRTNLGKVTIVDSEFFSNTSFQDGGAIWNYLELEISDSILAGNSATNHGGGIWNNGEVDILNTQITDNITQGNGGGAHIAGVTTIVDSTISGNYAKDEGGGMKVTAPLTIENSVFTFNETETTSFADGGALWLSGSGTTIRDSLISDNKARNGGGVYSFLSDVKLYTSQVTRNTATLDGGGIWTARSMQIFDSTIADNTASGNGGGIWTTPGGHAGKTDITNSTIADNLSMENGGGIWYQDRLNVYNSTISGNSAFLHGGGIYGFEPQTLQNTTIYKNVADSDGNGVGDGGGIYSLTGVPALLHTLVAGNKRGASDRDDIYGSAALEYSLLGDNSNAAVVDNGGNIIGTGISPIDPRLGPLQSLGGPTKTHGLLYASPALDAGNPAFTMPPDYDQRGMPFSRAIGVAIDIGAYEAQTPPVEADIFLDGRVDAKDVAILFGNWGLLGLNYADGNLDGVGTVDAADTGIMFGNWTGDMGPSANNTNDSPTTIYQPLESSLGGSQLSHTTLFVIEIQLSETEQHAKAFDSYGLSSTHRILSDVREGDALAGRADVRFEESVLDETFSSFAGLEGFS